MSHDEILQIGKFMSDLFGLITTLNTGMIGVIIAIVEKVFTTEKIFKSAYNKALFVASLLSFIGSLALSLVALAVIPNNTKEILLNKSNMWVDPFPFYGSIGLFFSGVFFFFVLAIRSVISGSTTDHKQHHSGEEMYYAE